MADLPQDDPSVMAGMAAWRERADHTLARVLSTEGAGGEEPPPQRLIAAMRHAALDGGKRMRPLLVYATGTTFGADPETLDLPAAAVELVHAYSLVHDDLPSMDDDSLRRGNPTVHVAYDEATAILAGDALQSLAFELLARAAVPPAIGMAMVGELARAAGMAGMCGGQALDIAATGRPDGIDIAALQRLHALKTGALLRAAVRLGALAAGVGDGDRVRLDRYADALGLAFQIRDDLLDVQADSSTLGKTAGKDAAQGKATFPGLLGQAASAARLEELADTMRDALAPFGPAAAPLLALGHRAIHRAN